MIPTRDRDYVRLDPARCAQFGPSVDAAPPAMDQDRLRTGLCCCLADERTFGRDKIISAPSPQNSII